MLRKMRAICETRQPDTFDSPILHSTNWFQRSYRFLGTSSMPSCYNIELPTVLLINSKSYTFNKQATLKTNLLMFNNRVIVLFLNFRLRSTLKLASRRHSPIFFFLLIHTTLKFNYIKINFLWSSRKSNSRSAVIKCNEIFFPSLDSKRTHAPIYLFRSIRLLKILQHFEDSRLSTDWSFVEKIRGIQMYRAGFNVSLRAYIVRKINISTGALHLLTKVDRFAGHFYRWSAR